MQTGSQKAGLYGRSEMSAFNNNAGVPMDYEDNDKMVSPRSSAPAEGERRAIGGYYPQYRISASLILRGLREERLQWIRVAEPEAGRLDDLQIGSQSRVDAFQVKWSKYGGNFTFKDLIRPSGDKPSLIVQLADGWMRLQRAYPGHRIMVHLVTNESLSVSDKPPVSDPPPIPQHFAAFIEQVWNPAGKVSPNSSWSVPEAWQPAWQALRVASGLSVADFEAFVWDCELEFGYRLPGSERAIVRDQEIAQQDLEHLTQTLFATVADPARIIELTRDQLLARLGWEKRFEFKSHHEFPEPEIPYHPIEATLRQLEQALSNLPGGYIAVLGTPGSGKSTLLTQTFRYRPERVIRYYAYVPDAQDPITLRGESVNFLHDVVLALERAGFRVGESPSQFERDQLLERFYKQLCLLHQHWQATGRKTMIMVDGLDHIAREQHPNRSLLCDLPLPEQVPEGVYFVLGSQTDAPFPDRVQAAVCTAARRIEMEPLSREAVVRITERTGLSAVLTEEQKEEIYVLSDGHPLALGYLLSRLRNVTDTKAIETMLQSTERYEGDIEAQYHSYWRQIETDDDLARLLGLLARLRGVIDLSWVETWAGYAVLNRLRRRLAHYFRIENHNRWYFFHNSFRLFILQKTAESSSGVFDPSRDRALHHELAERCAQAPAASHWAWEELYHRVLAEEHEAVLERTSQEWFRSQFLAFRPIDAIQADIRLALRSATAREDPVALTRLVLAGAEMAQREFYLESASFVPLLLDLGEKQVAVEHVRDGKRLRIGATAALRISLELKSAELFEEARRVFELAEPLDLLAAPAPIKDDPQGTKGAHLEAWAEAAIHFHDLDKVMETIRKVRRGADRFGQRDTGTASRSLQNRMLFHVGLALLNEQRWDDLAIVGRSFDTDHIEDSRWWFWLQVHAWKDRVAAGDQSRARYFLKQAWLRASALGLGSEERVTLAEGVYRVLGDEEQAHKWLQGVSQPELRTDVLASDSGLNPFLHRFRLNRLLYALGDQRSLAEIIPDSSEPRHQGMVYFERALCVIARIWAEAWRGRQLDSSIIARETLPLLRLFNRRWRETRDWISWYAVQGARGDFYTLLVDAVTRHGPEAIESLRILFEREWGNPETGAFWPADVRRQVIVALEYFGVERRWAVERLRALENMMREGHDVSGRIDECRKQAEAWIALGNKESARDVLHKMLQVSFGVGYRKDYQPDTWIEWLGRINEVEPERAAERINWFSRAITTLEETTEGRASRYAANELLAVTFRWSPRRAVFLFQWFLNQRLVWHEEAVRILLSEALKAVEPPTQSVFFSLADFVLPVATEADPGLAVLLIKRTATHHGNNKALETARNLVSKISVHALPSTRSRWRRGIATGSLELGFELHNVGLERPDLRPHQDEDGSSSSLKLKDSSTLSTDELKMRVCSVSDLQELLDSESDESYFDWEPIVAHLVEGLDSESVYTLAKLFQGKHRAAPILAILSETLCDLGDLQGAWSLGEQALNASKAYGWDRWYDGGSRLAAFRALVRADADRARPHVYDRLIRDLTAEFWYPQNIALNLEEILSLLNDDIPVQEIWSEVERYVQALFEGTSLLADGPTDLDQQPLQDTPPRAVADLLMLHLAHPASVLAQAAQRACAKLLLRRDSVIQDAVHEFLEKTESHQEHILMVLDAVSLQDPDAVAPFRGKIVSMHRSPNYAIRRAVRTICGRIGCEPAQASHSPTPLPAIYQLVLPPRSAASLFGRGQILPAEPLPDSDEPFEIIRPFDMHIKLVAEGAQLPGENVGRRVVQIMHQLAPQDSWSARGEKRLRAMLDSAGLRLSFNRPRAVLARRAMFYVVAELVDAKLLGLSSLRRLERILRFYDPVMVLAEPARRPPDICPIAGRRQHGGDNEEWLERVDEAAGSVSFGTTDGLVILAEETILKRLEWEAPTEIRRCVVCLSPASHFNPDDDYDSFFHRVTNCLVTEYPNLQVNAVPMPLIFRHTAYGYDSPGENWLALNPAVGRRLGWNLAEDSLNLFRWVNDEGQTMVESVWWADGFVGQSPPPFRDEVAEGWLVVASQAAWDAIALQFGTLKRIVNVERSVYENGQRLKRDMHSEQVV